MSEAVQIRRRRAGLGSGLRPGLAAPCRDDNRTVRGDIVAGLTVAARLVPQVPAAADPS